MLAWCVLGDPVWYERHIHALDLDDAVVAKIAMNCFTSSEPLFHIHNQHASIHVYVYDLQNELVVSFDASTSHVLHMSHSKCNATSATSSFENHCLSHYVSKIYSTIQADLYASLSNLYSSKTKPMVLTGSGVGGSLATMFAFDAMFDPHLGFRLTHLTTFGAYPIGNEIVEHVLYLRLRYKNFQSLYTVHEFPSPFRHFLSSVIARSEHRMSYFGVSRCL